MARADLPHFGAAAVEHTGSFEAMREDTKTTTHVLKRAAAIKSVCQDGEEA